MKKKIGAVVLCFVLAVGFTACGSQNESGKVVASVTENPSGNTETHEEIQISPMMWMRCHLQV